MNPPSRYHHALATLRELGILNEALAAVHAEHATMAQVFEYGRGPNHVARARGELATLLRERLSWSFPVIGTFLGRDHSTIMCGIAKCRARRREQPALELVPILPDLVLITRDGSAAA